MSHAADTDTSLRENARAVQRVLLVGLALNLLVAASKGVFGLATGALAVAADGVHSLVDGASNVVGLVVVRAASAAPDRQHPYGHHKVEIVAAVGIGLAVGLAAVNFAWDAVEALQGGRPPLDTSPLGFVVLGGTLAVNIFVVTYQRRWGRRLDSVYLLADAEHTASDVLVTCGVLLSYGAAWLGVSWADPVGALVVVVVIARVAWRIIRRNLGVLIDRAALDPQAVAAVVAGVTGVRSCHKIRSRGTAQAVYVDLHIQVDGGQSLRSAHELSHDVSDAIRGAFPSVVDVTVHTEPWDAASDSVR